MIAIHNHNTSHNIKVTAKDLNVGKMSVRQWQKFITDIITTRDQGKIALAIIALKKRGVGDGQIAKELQLASSDAVNWTLRQYGKDVQ